MCSESKRPGESAFFGENAGTFSIEDELKFEVDVWREQLDRSRTFLENSIGRYTGAGSERQKSAEVIRRFQLSRHEWLGRKLDQSVQTLDRYKRMEEAKIRTEIRTVVGDSILSKGA